jgi:hypothetical protein
MFMETTSLGLAVIIAAWLVQIAYSWKGGSEIKAGFLLLYAAGCVIIALGGFAGGLNAAGVFNLGCAAAAVVVLSKLKTRKRQTAS